jgi:hypothetical protein
MKTNISLNIIRKEDTSGESIKKSQIRANTGLEKFLFGDEESCLCEYWSQ